MVQGHPFLLPMRWFVNASLHNVAMHQLVTFTFLLYSNRRLSCSFLIHWCWLFNQVKKSNKIFAVKIGFKCCLRTKDYIYNLENMSVRSKIWFPLGQRRRCWRQKRWCSVCRSTQISHEVQQWVHAFRHHPIIARHFDRVFKTITQKNPIPPSTWL